MAWKMLQFFIKQKEEVDNKTAKLMWLSIHEKVYFVSLNYTHFLRGA